MGVVDRLFRSVFVERIIRANYSYYGHLAKMSKAAFNDERALSEYVLTSIRSMPDMLSVDIMVTSSWLVNCHLGASVGRNFGAPRTARTWAGPTPAHREALGRPAVLGEAARSAGYREQGLYFSDPVVYDPDVADWGRFRRSVSGALR